MKVEVGGARGSRPVHGDAFRRYGGATTAFRLRAVSGEVLYVDAGSGLGHWPPSPASGPVTLLITHPHHDHLLGLLGSGLVEDDSPALTIAVAEPLLPAVREAVGRLFGPPLWPRSWEVSSANVTWQPVGPGGVTVGGFQVTAYPVAHPGGCAAYRIEADGAVVVIATDMEWIAMTNDQRDGFIRFAREPGPPDLLLVDGQYGEQEITRYAGWGHTSREKAVVLGSRCRARRCWITHHDPAATDASLADFEQELQTTAPGLRLAATGMHVDLSPSCDQQ